MRARRRENSAGSGAGRAARVEGDAGLCGADRQEFHAVRTAGEPVAGVRVDHDRIVGAERHPVGQAAAAADDDEQLIVVVLVGRYFEVGRKYGAIHEEPALAEHQFLPPRSGALRFGDERLRRACAGLRGLERTVPVDLGVAEDVERDLRHGILLLRGA